MLTWQNIRFQYGQNFCLDIPRFELVRKDFVLFLGPNGSGKTTLFKLGVRLLEAESGRVILNGKPLKDLSQLEIAKKIAFLEQNPQYFFPFTVEEVVLMGRYPHNHNQYWDRKEDLEIAAWAMEVTGVLRFAKRSVFQLSGGERRKVEIAQAICQQPEILFLDEPTTFLDIKQQRDFFELLARLHREQHLTIALISHHFELAESYINKAVLIKNGRIHHSGAPSSVLSAESISAGFDL